MAAEWDNELAINRKVDRIRNPSSNNRGSHASAFLIVVSIKLIITYTITIGIG